MASIYRSHVAHIREPAYGSSSGSSSNAMYIPVTSFDEWEDDRERILDSGIRGLGAKDYFVYQGVNRGRFGWTSMFYPNLMTRSLMDIFGREVVTQSSAGAVAVHTFGSTDLPNSAMWLEYYGVPGSERAWRGQQMERLELKFDVGSGAMTAKTVYVGYGPSSGIAENTASFTSDTPFRGWQGALTLAGSTNNRLIGFNLTIQREVNLVYSAINSQSPVSREVGALEVFGTATFYGGTSSGGSTETEYNLFRNGTSTSLALAMSQTSSSNSDALSISLANCAFYPVTLDRGGSFVRWNVSFRGFYNGTDSGPASIGLSISTTSATT